MNNRTYLNTAACGLLPSAFTTQAEELYDEMSADASTHAEHWRDNVQPELRKAVGKLLNTDVENIALLPNFSWGINGVVQSLKGTERILMYKNDYPSLTEPFKIKGFDITWVGDEDGFAIDVAAIKTHILAKQVDILAISHVQWMSGFKVDLKELGTWCKENDVLFIVDATQSLGAIEIDLGEMNVDVLISSNYKWMNAGFGTGVMYMNRSFIERYTPAVGGHNSYVLSEGKWIYQPSVRSFEPGHPNMYGFSVLHAAIKHKLEMGVSKIEEDNKALTQQLLDELRTLGINYLGDDDMERRASIIFIKDENGVWDKLKEHNIIASQRGGNIRFGIHYYNTEADIKKLVDCLKP
ncbi:MAG: aminotransferase class V-fold PLP-dependent enzyme [Flavipsychrobacter sp.]